MYRFCTRCGDRVKGYEPSSTPARGWILAGFEPPFSDDEPHYWCGKCQTKHLAVCTGSSDTVSACESCGDFMPLHARFCGACGSRLAFHEEPQIPDEEPGSA